MEEDLILKQPTDRRLGNLSALPPGPPGVELDAAATDFAKKSSKETNKDAAPAGSSGSKSSRRRSPSSPLPDSKRKSPVARGGGRRTPSPAATRRRRSPSPRGGRSRYRDYSPERRGYGGRSRRSPDRRRSPPMRDRRNGRGGDGGRGYRGGGRSRTRSPVSPRRGSGSRWSPKKKPNSPPMQQQQQQLNQPPPTAQYGVMPPNMYADAYAYNQYGAAAGPPPGFVQPDFTMAPPPTAFVPAAYQAAPVWGVQDNYAPQTWLPPPTMTDPTLQMQQQQPPPLQQQQQQQQMAQTLVPTPPQQTTVVVPNIAASTQAPVAVKLNILPDAAPGTVDPHPAHDAVAQEAENQRDELKKQRHSYLKKTAVLKKELKMLKEQRMDLNAGEVPASPTTKGFIDENEKLQCQIEKKLTTIENVIDMLTGIIGEENLEKENEQMQLTTGVVAQPHAVARKQSKYKKSTSTSDSSSDSSSSEDSSSSSSSEEQDEDDSSPERLKHKAIASMRSKQKEGGKKEHVEQQRSKHKEEQNKVEDKKFNYVFYDPEMHWCKTCDILPKTAKDYLNHLHSKEHLERERVETPWHAIMVNDQYPLHENAPTKRTPIRGLTFFVPATAWYCKLCNIWMGDLHCASSHLKSQEHANKYNAYLEQHPHFEVDWLAERQRALNTKRAVPPPQQITSVSTTASEHVGKKSKKEEEKSKKRKKKSSDKKDKKKKKRSKKRKKAAVSSSSSSSSAESTSENEEPKYVAPALNNANPAASIRVAMRKQSSKIETIETEIPPAPSMKLPPPQPVSGPIGKWTVTQEGIKKSNEEESKRDDAIISQWNTVQPVISESEKKLLEQLKGKLKNKPNIMESHSAITAAAMAATAIKNSASATISSDRAALEAMGKGKERSSSRRDDKERGGGGSTVDSDSRGRRRASRSRSPRYGGRGGRSRSRSRGRGGYRGRGGGGGGGRRSRSRSRGRFSPVGWRDGGGRRRRSRSRSMRRRSRSYDRRHRGGSRSSRSRSGSPRIEKAVVRLSEFRPRVPEKDKEKEIKKQTDAKEKKESNKKAAAAAAKTKTSGESTAKKLPFIGKMPVFKKHASGAEGGVDQKDEVYDEATAAAHMAITQAAAARNMAPTAAQIQMAMMEDVYGNAPPFHPDNMMMDYDDLMPDPVQFVSIMGQAPPPPPPESDDDKDMLPPGIDETESEEFVPKPISEAPIARKGPLPKDFEEALNIIFPGEKRPGDDDDADRKKKSSGETQIIVDAPVMQPEDLAREGIHMVTLEETMDEASQLSMNEPLIFKKRSSSSATACAPEDASSQNASDIDLAAIEPPSQLPKIAEEVEVVAAVATAPPAPAAKEIVIENAAKVAELPAAVEAVLAAPPAVELATITLPMEDIPIPAPPAAAADVVVDETSAVVYDLDDIPQPPPSPTESEKHRRQEELDDLAMLGIDASDMAAQCM